MKAIDRFFILLFIIIGIAFTVIVAYLFVLAVNYFFKYVGAFA